MSGDVIAFPRDRMRPSPGIAPVLPAWLLPGGKYVRLYCEHCRDDHIHGAAGIVDGRNAHRIAHCVNAGSPYKVTGYTLVVQAKRRS